MDIADAMNSIFLFKYFATIDFVDIPLGDRDPHLNKSLYLFVFVTKITSTNSVVLFHLPHCSALCVIIFRQHKFLFFLKGGLLMRSHYSAKLFFFLASLAPNIGSKMQKMKLNLKFLLSQSGSSPSCSKKKGKRN